MESISWSIINTLLQLIQNPQKTGVVGEKKVARSDLLNCVNKKVSLRDFPEIQLIPKRNLSKSWVLPARELHLVELKRLVFSATTPIL